MVQSSAYEETTREEYVEEEEVRTEVKTQVLLLRTSGAGPWPNYQPSPALALARQGYLDHKRRKYAAAIRSYQKALEAAEASKTGQLDDKELAVLFFHLGNAYRAVSEFEKAHANHERADKLAQDVAVVREDEEFYWDLTISLARDYRALKRPAEAIEACQRLETLCQSQSDQKKRVFNQLLADIYVDKFVELNKDAKPAEKSQPEEKIKSEEEPKKEANPTEDPVSQAPTVCYRSLEARESFENACSHYHCLNAIAKNAKGEASCITYLREKFVKPMSKRDL